MILLLLMLEESGLIIRCLKTMVESVLSKFIVGMKSIHYLLLFFLRLQFCSHC